MIERAREILFTLERKERDVVEETRQRAGLPALQQMSLFGAAPREQDVLDALRVIEVDALTPIQALNELAKLKEKLGGG